MYAIAKLANKKTWRYWGYHFLEKLKLKSYHPNELNNRIIPFVINKYKNPIATAAIATGNNKGNKKMKAIPTSTINKISMMILLENWGTFLCESRNLSEFFKSA
ncbi:MAG: hypothetical protein VKK42_22570 [Lyngbya sp.]|nr:hypothetical protein [Lyngbya sp.]